MEVSIATGVYNENVYYVVSSATPPFRRLASGAMPIDLAFDITNHQLSSSSNSSDEDMYAMRALFHNLFQQADIDKSGSFSFRGPIKFICFSFSFSPSQFFIILGSLSFFEIQGILEKIHVGLTPQEISLLIAAADVDASGEVDYNEFVPLAVDM